MARATFTTPSDWIAVVSADLFIVLAVLVTAALSHIPARGRYAHAESDAVGAVGKSAANSGMYRSDLQIGCLKEECRSESTQRRLRWARLSSPSS
jgi:hypothetical protein